jgi:hypothetical protein
MTWLKKIVQANQQQSAQGNAWKGKPRQKLKPNNT